MIKWLDILINFKEEHFWFSIIRWKVQHWRALMSHFGVKWKRNWKLTLNMSFECNWKRPPIFSCYSLFDIEVKLNQITSHFFAYIIVYFIMQVETSWFDFIEIGSRLYQTRNKLALQCFFFTFFFQFEWYYFVMLITLCDRQTHKQFNCN